MSAPERTDDGVRNRHALLAEAFALLGSSLGPMIDERMTQYFDNDPSWEETASNRMGRATEHGASDPLFQLLVLRRFWGPVFAEFYGTDLRPLITQLIEARNLWAHLSLPDDTGFLDRTVLGMERLIAPATAESLGDLRGLRAKLLHPSGGEAAPTGPGFDEAELLSQLDESAEAFRELQATHEDLADQLHASKRAVADKQLRLAQLENHLQGVIQRTTELEASLTAEAQTRGRIEWLFVGMLAVLLAAIAVTTTI